MRFCCVVLIAAVTVNCLVTAINGKTATKTVIEPSNMLLPPLEDKPQDAKAPATTTTRKPTTTKTTTTTTTTRKPTTTAKPVTNNVNNVVPELSIEALLPPLFEAKIEKAEDKHKQSGETTTKSTTTKTVTNTAYTTTTTATTSYTQKPIELSKPTKKPLKDVKQYTKQSSLANKHVADAGRTKPIAQHVISNIEKRITNQVVAKVAQKKLKNTISSAASTSTINYNLNGFDIYLGSTTPRPPKYGLPTITPFPRRLG